VDNWESHASYQKGLRIVNALPVIDDGAECGVELIQDFDRSLTRKEDDYQNQLLTVQNYREKFADRKKSTRVTQYSVRE